MTKKRRIISLTVWVVLLVLCLVGIFLVEGKGHHEEIGELMQDAVLHESNRVDLFGLIEVNPAVISAFTVTGILLVLALLVRIFAVPRFRTVPGRLQMLLEQLVGFFRDLGRGNSPHCYGFLSVYIFGAGVYIFFGTLFELFGVQAITTHGAPISLPAPLSDINAAIAMGCTSYLVILLGGLFVNGLRGAGHALKDFSLPISMSFRLFGALLSGLLVTELVYYYKPLSFGLPVVVGVLFTLIHALVQTYVLTMLTSVFFGESTERHEKHEKQPKHEKKKSKKETSKETVS